MVPIRSILSKHCSVLQPPKPKKDARSAKQEAERKAKEEGAHNVFFISLLMRLSQQGII